MAQQAVTLHCRLSSKARLAYLLDHVVMGRALLPAAAMMELAAATAATLTQDSAHDSGDLLSVNNMSISAPIVLPSGGAQDSDEFEVCCSLDVVTGQLSIGYTYTQDGLGGAGFQPVTCATATASLVKGVGQQDQQAVQLQAKAASLLAGTLAESNATAAAARTAAAGPVGVIAPVAGDSAASGYFSAPQQVDSALHLGVVAPGSGAKVPVALGSFLVPSASARTAGTGPMFASTSSRGSHDAAAGLSTSSFLLRSCDDAVGDAAVSRVPGQASVVAASTGGLVVVVEDLQTKVVKTGDLSKIRMQPAAAAAGTDSKQAGADTATDSGDDSSPCSYETEWQVKEAAAYSPQLESRHAGKLSLLVHDTPAAATAGPLSEHLVLQLRLKAADTTLTPAAAAASTLAVLQQVNQAQQAHAAAGAAQQLGIHVGLSLARGTLGPADGLQGLTGGRLAADASNAVWGLLRTEATEQTTIPVSLQALDSSMASKGPAVSAVPGALAATAAKGGVVEVPRLLSCSKPEGAEFITIRPEPRSALSNLVARAADVSQVSNSLISLLIDCYTLIFASQQGAAGGQCVA